MLRNRAVCWRRLDYKSCFRQGNSG
ncbi:MAG TPA: hypothetical protein O0X09_00390 [Methanocorpusculum sp.]|nr:hypothetical protein [Methanocorpusculum sp.]HJJ66618.1 hypothetical protein [Methanocorpusculum sp.]HJJ75169.1 hypothetical protein [Methanocorpusculum sp.]HJJ75607.1 hypothetical protein [Methanocorpusculum sp.]HJJ78957.1 hypothetical protein [Methanocorpusculum sp.]